MRDETHETTATVFWRAAIMMSTEPAELQDVVEETRILDRLRLALNLVKEELELCRLQQLEVMVIAQRCRAVSNEEL
eukprot:TsM_001098500 transcript=TsM_001098500 gene=TsM_001098500